MTSRWLRFTGIAGREYRFEIRSTTSVGQRRNIFQCRAFTRALPVKTPGKRTELTGRLQQRYGYAKDQAEREIDAWLKDAA